MPSSDRRQFLAAVATTGSVGLAGCSNLLPSSGSKSGEDFPSGRLDVVIPFGQGGGTDIYARRIWSKVSEIADVGVKMENITGAGGMRGGAEVYNSDPDGYTVAPMNSPEVTTTLVDDTDFRLNEFRGIASHARTAMVILTNSDHNVENFDDFAGRYQSGDFKSIGGMSPGSPTHLIALLFKEDFDIPWQNYVPYDGTGPVAQAVASGELPAGIVTETTAESVSGSGDVDIVAALTSDGSAVFPDLESHTEYGYPNIDYAGQITRFFLTTPDTPEERVQKLADLVEQAIKSEGLQGWSEDTGNPLNFHGGPQYVDDLIEQAYEEVPEKVDIEALRG